MRISWHGHSCVQIHSNSNHRIIIDPFISGNPSSDLNVDTLHIDYILLTHAHNDHFGDTVELAKKNDALVITLVEIADYLEAQGVKVHGMNLGGQYKFPFGNIKMVPALHSSSLYVDEETIPLGNPAGFVMELEDKRIYHAGDTALFSDMSLIAPIDLAMLPIGDNFTMGIDDAIKAAEFLDAKNVIPLHYNTFPVIEQDPHVFINGLKQAQGILPEVGEIIEF